MSREDELRRMREAAYGSRGGVESRHTARTSVEGGPKAVQSGSLVASSATETQRRGVTRNQHGQAGVASGPREANRRRGRPLLENVGVTLASTKPWEALGMSRRTWYRRQQELKK